MITAGAASDKISELRSKLAIYAAWTELIETNYLPSDGADAETSISRADGGRVVEAHFRSFLEDVEARCEELREELSEWESLVFQPKREAAPEAAPQKGEVHELKPSPAQKRVERNRHGRRLQASAAEPKA